MAAAPGFPAHPSLPSSMSAFQVWRSRKDPAAFASISAKRTGGTAKLKR